MDLQFYNTRTRSREVFAPIDPGNVRLYACGPTVYDRSHIGNARPAVVFDVLYRFLCHCYGTDCVTYVRNITDIDDKINARAASVRDGRPLMEVIREITGRTIAWYHEDMDSLGVLRPSHEPRATEFIPEMIEMISALVRTGHAYEAEGHVLFSVASYEGYGSLARRSLDDMLAGARVEQAPYKRSPMDFVLWKPSTDDLPGWSSPWGRGRPGWHIECSAMSLDLLGTSFDIHGGGIDLVFPHHENESAQSLCANPGSGFANIWMHNGFLQVEGEKMAKSLGNFITVKDLRDQGIDGGVIRLALLSTHYRQPMDWTERKVADTRKVLGRWRKLSAGAETAGEPNRSVIAALADDLNTPKAISELHAVASAGDAAGLKASAEFLGISMDAPPRGADSASEIIGRMLEERAAARRSRDFSTADAIRDRLAAAGIEISDSPEGTSWSLSDGFDPERIPDLESGAKDGG